MMRVLFLFAGLLLLVLFLHRFGHQLLKCHKVAFLIRISFSLCSGSARIPLNASQEELVPSGK